MKNQVPGEKPWEFWLCQLYYLKFCNGDGDDDAQQRTLPLGMLEGGATL